MVPVAVRCLLLALVLLPAGCGSSARPGPLEQAQLCSGFEAATEEFLRQHPDAPAEQARAAAAQACREGFQYAPQATETPMPASPGCRKQTKGANPKPLRRRTLGAPATPVPFFAQRPGALPRDGAATVGGLQLPRGSRCMHHWATDEPVADAVGLASRLAAAFPETGLWPVLWDNWEDPDNFLMPMNDLRRADRADAERVLRRAWARMDVKKPAFPALAPGSPDAAKPAVPFQTYAGSLSPSAPRPPGGPVLLLVPVNRPADVVSVLGAQLTQFDTDDELTTVLRSWEERFGAVPVAVGAGTLDVAVGAPPRARDQAVRLAYEHYAFNSQDDTISGFDDLPRVAEYLRGAERDPEQFRTPGLWRFGWMD